MSTEVTRKKRPTGVSAPLLADRREYAVGLKLMGMSVATILKQVNAQDKVKGWGVVSRRTIERDIAAYFRKNRALSLHDYDHLDQMRESHLAQSELTIEKMALHIANKKDYDVKTPEGNTVKGWKPFEKADALDKLHKMQMNFAELQNWNLGRKNPVVAIEQNNINNVFDAASADLIQLNKNKPKAIEGFCELIDGVIDQIKDEKLNGEEPQEELLTTTEKE